MLALAAAPHLRRLLAAQALIVAALGVARVVVPWVILAAGGSAFAAALGYLISYAPYAVLGLPAGLAGDRLGPGRLTVLAGCVGLASAALLGAALADGHPSLAPVVVVAGLVIGIVAPFADAALYATLRDDGDDGFVASGSLISAIMVAGRVVGPIGAGVSALLGPTVPALLIGTCFALAALLGLREMPADQPGPVRHPRHEVTAALRYLRGPAGRYAAASGAWNVAIAGVALALLAPFVASLGGDITTGSLVVLAGNLSALAVSVALLPRLLRRMGPERLARLALPSSALGVGLFTLAPSPLAAIVLHALVYLPNQLWIGSVLVAVQRDAPAGLRSTVATLSRIVTFAGFVFGSLLSGAASGILGLVPTMWCGVAATASLALVYLIVAPTRTTGR